MNPCSEVNAMVLTDEARTLGSDLKIQSAQHGVISIIRHNDAAFMDWHYAMESLGAHLKESEAAWTRGYTVFAHSMSLE